MIHCGFDWVGSCIWLVDAHLTRAQPPFVAGSATVHSLSFEFELSFRYQLTRNRSFRGRSLPSQSLLPKQPNQAQQWQTFNWNADILEHKINGLKT